MSRRTKRRKPMAEINVVPYIDVTLVLLIIFMITTPMLQTGIQVDLPQTKSTAPVEQKEDTPPIVVSITEQGEYYLKVDSQDDERVRPEEIEARVAVILTNKPTTPVLISADKHVDYGTVVAVMTSLTNAGASSLDFQTKPE